MSHNVVVNNIKITDLVALEQAVNELKQAGSNISIAYNCRYRGYDTRQSIDNMPVVIKLHDAPWDIGFGKDEQGNYNPVFDPYKGYVQKEVGYYAGELDSKSCDVNSPSIHLGRLIQHYTACKIEREVAMQGHSVTRTGIDPVTKQFNLIVSGGY